MSSARKIKARRKGQQQKEAARVRHPNGWTGRPLFPPGTVIKYAPDLLETRPRLTEAALREALEQIQAMREPIISEVHLSPRDIAYLTAAQGPLPSHSIEMRRTLTGVMGVRVAEDHRIPWGAALVKYTDGTTRYLPPDSPQS